MVYVPGGFAIVVFSSIEVSSTLSYKVCQGCVPPWRFVHCFDSSAWTSPFYGLTADVSN